MFTWSFSESIVTKTKPSKIWRYWSDPKLWPKWDKALEDAELDGPFEKGAIGRLKPRGKDWVPFEIISTKINCGFQDVSKILGIKIKFTHDIQAKSHNSWTVTHSVKFSGTFCFLLRWNLGKQLKKGFVESLNNLNKIASN